MPNRLAGEKSPYLLQHADNPVDWRPWGEEAFAEAARAHKPVFLSIGYSTCHWCHVMERESFSEPEVADLLNRSFICVKVDREERPDVDALYMGACQMMTGTGGWPLSLLLTPEKKPVWAGTYSPRETLGGHVGMTELVPALARIWREDRLSAEKMAEEVTAALSGAAAVVPGPSPGRDTLDRAFSQLAARFDRDHGGFDGAPKFPQPSLLLFLLRFGKRTGEAEALEMASLTLSAMRRGGIFDQLGGGFHRYSTDESWLLPHFEKMLYDQALLALACAEAFDATGREEYRETAREVLDYLLRDLSSPEGGFFTAEDAESDGEEGAFYLWTREEVRKILSSGDADLAAEAWGLSEKGNLPPAVRGKPGSNILHLPRPLPELSDALGIPLAELTTRLGDARERLLAARGKRPRPFRDEKVLADWNGLTLAALARAGYLLEDMPFLEAGERAAGFLLSRMRDAEGRLLHRWRDGAAGIPAFLDDHAALAWGLLELHLATSSERWLTEAVRLADEMVSLFWDEQHGGFFLAAGGGDLPVRQKLLEDGALPSGNSLAALVLVRLGRLLGRRTYQELFRRLGETFSGIAVNYPTNCAFFLTSLESSLAPEERP